MANVRFAEQENTRLQVPSLKMRPRLQSAPENTTKSSLMTKTFSTPLSSAARQPLAAAVNKVTTLSVNAQENKLLKPQEAKVEQAAQTKEEEYPDIEQMFDYNPLEFEKLSVPEDVVQFSGLVLHGLFPGSYTQDLGEDLDLNDTIQPLPEPPLPKRSDYCSELEDFLQIIEEIELPPEHVYEEM